MDYISLMNSRHAVRQYTDEEITGEVLNALKDEIKRIEKESHIKFNLVLNEPLAFDCYLSNKLGFKGVKNYIVITGPKGFENEMLGGYYGEQIVLKAQQLGLNTCWVAHTFSKKKLQYNLEKGEQLICVITIGYGETQGKSHKNCSIDKLCDFRGDMPHWFMSGMDTAMLAPTAKNEQKFCLVLRNRNEVTLKSRGGSCKGVTLGIVKFHFEIGAGKENFEFV